ncbi:hypothetical protein HYC85_030413 [Camellia sinensis]|uniref:Uncharacterized protein n=1 Tax=Camellia sinensis TaxID=4442 RepID=A0A7J7G0T9_CAMSI|nr:hypothetical protein HYC85_030413 [Camellia sinensis]
MEVTVKKRRQRIIEERKRIVREKSVEFIFDFDTDLHKIQSARRPHTCERKERKK